MSKAIKVEATEPGYYVSLHAKGETFFIKDEQAFSERWMKRVPVAVKPEPKFVPKPTPITPAPAATHVPPAHVPHVSSATFTPPEVTHGGPASPA